jgi:hypothetical protein
MSRSVLSAVAAATLLAVAACSPDDDRADVPYVDDVYAPAPVMPDDTMMMRDTTLIPDTLGVPR